MTEQNPPPEFICPHCQKALAEQEDGYHCSECAGKVGERRAEFYDFMLDVELDDDYQKFYEEDGTEADSEGGPRINAQQFKIPNLLEVLPDDYSGGRYMDLGCGGGWIIESLTEKVTFDQTWGLDISATRLAEASRRNPEATFLRAPVEAVPLPDDSFDLLTCLDVIEHLPRPELLLEEARRLSDRLLIKFPIEATAFDHFQKELWWPFKRKMKELLTGRDIEPPFEAHLHRFSFNSARQLLTDNGFEIVDEHSILNPWTQAHTFMNPRAFNITEETPLFKKIDFHLKRVVLLNSRRLAYLLLRPIYYRLFNSGVYFYCRRA